MVTKHSDTRLLHRVRIWPPPTPDGYRPKSGEKAGTGPRTCGGQITVCPKPTPGPPNHRKGSHPPSTDRTQVWSPPTPDGCIPKTGGKAGTGPRICGDQIPCVTGVGCPVTLLAGFPSRFRGCLSSNRSRVRFPAKKNKKNALLGWHRTVMSC